MSLTKLNISNFRNLASVQLEPNPHGFNLVYGQNGSGKTSILEAIYYLSLGRSFRSSAIARIIRHNEDKFALFANIRTKSSQLIPLGIERCQNSDVKIRVSGKDVCSFAELAQITPVLLINPNCYFLLDGGPTFRRKYLDWGIFYQNNDFLRVWRQFNRILKQRNAALQSRRPKKELDTWTSELVGYAEQLAEVRKQYIEQLIPLLHETLATLIDLPTLKITYQPGWEDEANYIDVLNTSFAKDIEQGYTHYGPHRADLKITLGTAPAKDILSRGQQKLFVCAMILAQGALLHRCANKKPIYLVDDLPSELDVASRSNLIALLSKQQAQVFVTTIAHDAVSEFLHETSKVFHVEHGQITEMTIV